jgi:hypothetical protein
METDETDNVSGSPGHAGAGAAAGVGAVVTFAAGVGGGVNEQVARHLVGHTRDVVDALSLGFEIWVATNGVPPFVHSQHGSPISRPFVCPSPSVSALQNSSVHVGGTPVAPNAVPKALFGPPPFFSSVCPSAGVPAAKYTAAFGIRAGYVG